MDITVIWVNRSLIDDCDRRDWLLDTEETATLNFLTIVLGFIYINSREMPQETLKSRLIELGFDYNTTYEDLGLIPDLLQKLVKSLYLDMFKPDSAEDRYVFVWGKRSKVLFSYESVTEFIVDVN